MFTPKIEGLREITTPHFSKKIDHNPKIELSSLPHSIEHLSDEELFEQIQELTNHNGSVNFEQIKDLRKYGMLWIDDFSNHCIVLKSRKDIWADQYIENMIDYLQDGYYPNWLDNMLSQDQKERGVYLATSEFWDTHPSCWDECKKFVNQNENVMKKYLMENMDYSEILNDIGKNITNETKNLYLIEEY